MTVTSLPTLFSATMNLPELLAGFEISVHETIRKWEELCKETLRTGDSEAHHAHRDGYETILSGYLQMLEGCLRITRFHTDRDLVELTARMDALRDQVATHYNTLFPRWQTLDDLECILLAPLTPSKEQMDMIVANYPPPQSWFEETIDPFEPEKAS